MVRDKLQCGEETNDAVLVREHDSFTGLWNSSITLPPIFHTKLVCGARAN